MMAFILCFRLKIPFLGKFGSKKSKSQSCQYKLKFGTQTNSNMKNSMTVFIFSVFDRKNYFQKLNPLSLFVEDEI